MQDYLARLGDFSARAATADAAEARHWLDETSRVLASELARPNAQTPLLFANVHAALKRLPHSVATKSRVKALLSVAQFLYVSGQPFAGLEPAADAVASARELRDQAELRKALSYHGIILADTGNLPSAIESYAEALEIAQATGDVFGEGNIWNNLGAALIYAAQYAEAIHCFERVIQLAETDARLSNVRLLAYSNIALACLHLEDFAKGLRSAKAAIDAASEPKSPAELLSRVLSESYYTRLLLEVDSLERAKERCELAKRYAKEAKSERAELIAALSEGLYEVHAGMIDVGLSRLTQALERARILKSALRDALAAMVKAHEVAGKPDLALVYLRELMLHIKKAQQDNALRHHQLHIEKLERQQQAAASADVVMERREQQLRGQFAEQVAQQELMKSRIEMLERLAVTAELRDDSTGEHSYRVGKLAALLAAEFGCDDQTCFMIDLAARLHDIGKIGIPDGILLKPDRLTDAERQIMQTHTTVGAELLAQSNIPHMQMAEEIARFHHEWWDGSGYPFGIGGSAIPIAPRITALADVFDALTHKRPYKEPWPVARALEEIAYLKGHQFDPQLTDLFLALIPRLQREQGDLDEFLGRSARQSPFIQAREKIAATLRQFSGRGMGTRQRFDTQR
jgi:putative two-component system response regulator